MTRREAESLVCEYRDAIIRKAVEGFNAWDAAHGRESCES
jgi:hypothetical protein